MEFEITKKFIPRFYQADKLRITNIHNKSVSFEMVDSNGRGVYPRDQFQSLIRSGALVILENEIPGNEDSA